MGFVLGLIMDLFLIIVAFKCIGLGWHLIRSGFKTAKVRGDEWLSNLGKKQEKAAEPDKVVVVRTIEADAIDGGQS